MCACVVNLEERVLPVFIMWAFWAEWYVCECVTMWASLTVKSIPYSTSQRMNMLSVFSVSWITLFFRKVGECVEFLRKCVYGVIYILCACVYICWFWSNNKTPLLFPTDWTHCELCCAQFSDSGIFFLFLKVYIVYERLCAFYCFCLIDSNCCCCFAIWQN